MQFKFAMKQHVVITVSGETGQVIGRLDTINAENSYLVSYKNANGCSTKKWFDAFELAEAPAQ
ncbi:TPA: hypothetical protein ACVBYD_004638 [Yersinia enterocolitica]|uniref:hypothetical protein n=1 Tax=Yersinia kristensenii TaxID=28152 RepID=UPI0011A99E86|nr:hypothetical protein [Yersinia kristensenii]EKN3739187.1 hypothetical protein [Yersinia enterocolitica]QKJ16803.1 hypothetical protein HRD70_17380 [Yersinia kristensenii]HDL8251677.1 hypothetical protein [Yersinia enterocolitica]